MKKDTSCIRNKTKAITLVERVEWTENGWSRFKGLLGKKAFTNRALVIQPCNQVHTWFMCFSIDVLFINNQNEVIAKESALKPWAVSAKQRNATAVIEAEAGVFSNEKVDIGDVLEFVKADGYERGTRSNNHQ
ncbi:DUF192 domain-containing protein [bacterium LRH843]|nr:DUF192 domain-containing protein [bacterium LRH843]